MNILLAGASGATGRLLADELLKRGHNVKLIVRSEDKLPETIRKHEQAQIICARISELGDEDLAEHAAGIDAAASCLGHNLTLKGIYGQPRRLVTDTVRRLCRAVKSSEPDKPVKFVLMNTAGNSNRDLNEPISRGQKFIISILRKILPPHTDNEEASDYLRTEVGQNNADVEWAVVRPDTLIDEEKVTEYEIHHSPIRSAIFDPGKTSRINVAHFMAELITNEDAWNKWKGKMPVLYNK